MTQFMPRPSQREILAYRGGKLGICAVPGSGKTATLAELAANLVRETIEEDQEVLIVTLVNSAVDNFRQRINASAKEHGLLPNFGYRVRTLHGLAHDIVRERPGLVGLSEDFAIIDERESSIVREDTVEAWLRAHPEAADTLLADDVQNHQNQRVRRSLWPSLVRDVAAAFIKRAKDLQLTPDALAKCVARWKMETPGPITGSSLLLLQMGTDIYVDYQRSLMYRGVVDFDDLIYLALRSLALDPDYLARLQRRWPYILEDEAQDSSRLQQAILRLLAGPAGNWVRVGDPNQAIYETFTTADPRLLIRFVADKEQVTSRELPDSGRSQPAIIDLANHLIDWVRSEHPRSEARDALMLPHILPTAPGDPQTNPPCDLGGIQLIERAFTPAQELQAVVDSIEHWLPEHQDWTVAVLTPRNERGFEVIELLKQRGIPCTELLRSTSVTRKTAGAIGNLLRYLADPTSARKLSITFKVWRRDDRDDSELMPLLDNAARHLAGCPAVEAYLWPRADHDWLPSITHELGDYEHNLLLDFRDSVCRWLRAAILPVNQLILTLAADLFREPAELALAHKLAVLLRGISRAHPSYGLAELVEELAVIARNERRFLGFADQDMGFQPPSGMVTVATMHKAKGLEWDRVYLMSVNNYNYPSGLSNDSYIAERWFVRDNLNLEAEALALLETIVGFQSDMSKAGDSRQLFPPQEVGLATQRARLDYVIERLRLLYVGITRARRQLIITWNTGRRRSEKLQPAVPLIALQTYWQQRSGRACEQRR